MADKLNNQPIAIMAIGGFLFLIGVIGYWVLSIHSWFVAFDFIGLIVFAWGYHLYKTEREKRRVIL